MKAERQQKEATSRTIQPIKGNGQLSFVDNRPQAASQAKLIDSIQKKEDSLSPIVKRGDGVGCILQRTIDHAYNWGCEESEAANRNFKAHMSEYVEDPIELSGNRGKRKNTVIDITNRQLAEEIATELYYWPAKQVVPSDKIDIKTIGRYESVTFFDGEYLSEQLGKFIFKCQLVNRTDKTQYYEAFHLISIE